MPVCNHCGAPLENDALFCTACGAARGEASAGPAEATGRRLSIPFLLLGFGLALLLLTGAYFLLPKEGGAAPEPRLEGPGYSSPREAAEAFLQALSEGDLDAMLSSFAQESYVQQLDKGEYLNATSFVPNSSYTWLCFLPKTAPLPLEINTAVRRGELARSILSYYRDGLSPSPSALQMENPASPYYKVSDEESLRKLIEGLSKPSSLCSAQVRWIRSPQELAPEDAAQVGDLMEKYCRIYGTEELAELVVCLRMNGEDYCFEMLCGRYGEKWYNITLGGFFGILYGFSAGHLTPLSELPFS